RCPPHPPAVPTRRSSELPGGPGGAGLTMSAALAITKTQLFSDYELLGFDPRGFGQSTNVQCLIDVDELNEIPVVADYRERNAERSEEHTSELQSRENLVC